MNLAQLLAMQPAGEVITVDVFADGPQGGNPAPIVLNANTMNPSEMQAVARKTGHECGFVKPAPAGSGQDFSLYFWVPNHEMEMCGHVTVGTVWLMAKLGIITKNDVSIFTRSGVVNARIQHDSAMDYFKVEITQPVGTITDISGEEAFQPELLNLLGITSHELANAPIINASTSRIKTLIPLKDSHTLHNLQPNLANISDFCQRIGSTGLYPYASDEDLPNTFYARQFPKSSGYPEDAATGIAATALAFGLRYSGQVDSQTEHVTIKQGQAIGRPSKIEVTFRFNAWGEVEGCWLGGDVRFTMEHH